MQKKFYLLSAIILCSFFKLTAQVGFNLESQAVTCGQTITFPVTVSNFTRVTGVQYSINWDTSQVEYDRTGTNITTANLRNNARINDQASFTDIGQLTFVWFDLASVTLDDQDTINLFTFRIKGTNFNTTSISFTDNPTFIEVSDSVATPTPFSVNNAVLTLVDDESPTVSCPVAPPAAVVAGSSSVLVSGLTPNANDNCAIASMSYTLSGATTRTGTGDASGQAFNVGVTTVTYTVADGKGNTNSCAFEVKVDPSGPIDTTFIRPSNVVAECGAAVTIPVLVSEFDSITRTQLTLSWNPNQFTYNSVSNFNLQGLTAANFNISQATTGSISLNWTNAMPTTKGDGTPIFSLNLNPVSAVTNAPIIISNINVERKNATFPTKSNNATVTVSDITAPTISCPGNIIQTASVGQNSAIVNGLTPTVSDNCGTPTYTYALSGATIGNGTGDASGLPFNIGTTTVLYTATDANSRSATCSFSVMITGETPTTFTLIAQTQSADCSANELFVDIAVAAFDSIAGTQFSVNWDPSILNYTRTANVNFNSNVGFDTLDVDKGELGYSWFEAATASLNNGTALFRIYFTPNAGGTSPITFTGTPTPIEVNRKKDGNFQILPMDSINLLASSVVILDNIPPTITCPNNVTVQIPMGQTSMVINGLDPVVTDNCGIESISYTLSGATTGSGTTTASGQNFNAGLTTITYTVKDGGGNEQQCSSTVNIRVPSALQLNVVNQPANCGEESFQVDITVDSFTNVLGLQFSVDWDETVLEYSSIANYGLAEFNEANFTFQFTDDGKIGFAWFDDRAQGNDGETLEAGSILFSLFFKVLGGTGASTTVTIADDPVPREGNVKISTGQMVVPVLGINSQVTVIDNTPPMVSNGLPATIIRYVPADTCVVMGAWTEPTFSDLCSNIILTRTDAPNDFYTVGQKTIKYTATDGAGNMTVDSAIFIVRDTLAPIFINCPANMTVTPDANCQAIVTWVEPDVSDNCSEIVIVSSTHTPNTNFLPGTTTVTYFAEDVYGNQSTCSFDVTVSGSSASAINFENFPANITINAAQAQCGANIGWTSPTATGGCDNGSGGGITITSSSTPGDFFSVGRTAVIYTATDAAGFSKMDTFTVTVIDNQPFVTICPTDIEIQADGTVMMDAGNFINTVTSDSCGQYTITFNTINAFDNCSPVTITQTQGLTSGSTFTFGTTMMEFVTADTLGNSQTCTFQIIINETNDLMASTPTNPTCAGMNIQLMSDTLIGGSYQWSGPGGFLSNIQNPMITNAMTQNSGDYIVKVISTNGCTIKDTVSIGIRSAPLVEGSTNNIGCTADGDSLRLSATVINGIPVDTYTWTGPGGYTTDFQNPIIANPTASNAGIYTVTGTNLSSGCFGIDTVVVSIEGMVNPTLVSSAARDTVCLGDAFTLTGTAYDGIVTYTWNAAAAAGLPTNTDTNALVITPTAPGSYIYSFSANLDGGCVSDTARIGILVVDANNITLASNGPLACAAATATLDLTATGGTGIASYAWTGPNGFTSAEQNPSIPVVDATSGMYFLTATATSGCVSVDSIAVVVSAQGTAPEVTLSSNGNNVCGTDALAITAEEIVGATYAWTGPNGFTSTERVVLLQNLTDQNSGAYQVRYTLDGCTSAPRTVGPIAILSDPTIASDEYTVEVNKSIDFNVLANDVTISGVPFTINIVSQPQHGTLTNNMDGTFTYLSNTNFLVVDQIAYEFCYVDCPDLCGMATVTLRTRLSITECIAPTVITPNGDGMNDEFLISCVSNPPKQGSELIIFNEWGSEVFRETPYQNTWNGQYNGQDLPDGTYYYIFKQDSDDNNPIKGYFSLFR